MNVYGSVHVCVYENVRVFKLELVHPQDVGMYNSLGRGPGVLLLIQK